MYTFCLQFLNCWLASWGVNSSWNGKVLSLHMLHSLRNVDMSCGRRSHPIGSGGRNLLKEKREVQMGGFQRQKQKNMSHWFLSCQNHEQLATSPISKWKWYCSKARKSPTMALIQGLEMNLEIWSYSHVLHHRYCFHFCLIRHMLYLIFINDMDYTVLRPEVMIPQ